MGLLAALGIAKKPQPNLRVRLPAINTFVDINLPGGRAASVCIESIGKSSIVTSAALSIPPGTTVNFSYSTPTGKYRFSTKVTAGTGAHVTFGLPSHIEQLAVFGGQKRSAVRLDATVPGHWRLCHGGKGTGEFQRANIRDISRGGASLITDVHLKAGTHVEVKLSLGGTALIVMGEVMRTEKIATSGKYNSGLRFSGLRPNEDRAIMDFINRRQAELRNRGLA